MTVSNVHTFTMNRDEIIIEALELTAMHNLGDTPPPEQMESFARSLNLFFKSWQPKGLFLHTYKPATLFLAKDQQSYLLGPTGDHATESYIETSLSANGAALATVMTVTTELGMSVADNIGIVLDDGSLHWDTIASLAPLTITTGIASAATSGNEVYSYTTKIIRPLKISDVRINGTTETPISKLSISEYMGLTNKYSVSTCSQYAYDPQLDNVRLYVWPVASDVTEKIKFLYQKPVDDFTTDTDTATASTEWLQCLTLGLAYTIAPKVQLPLGEQVALKARFDEALAALDDFEETSIFFTARRR
jgi:hypothetical protein